MLLSESRSAVIIAIASTDYASRKTYNQIILMLTYRHTLCNSENYKVGTSRAGPRHIIHIKILSWK